MDNQFEKSDTLQNLNSLNSLSSLSRSSLDREDDDVYKYTTSMSLNVKRLIEHVNKEEVDQYLDRIKCVGTELRNLLATVDSLIETLPEWSHNEINMAHRILSKDFSALIDSMKAAQKYQNTTIQHEFKKKFLKAAHVLVVDSKTLLDTVDQVRLKVLSQSNEQQVLANESEE